MLQFLSQVYKPYKERSFYTCYCSLLHPKSRGTVTLQSNDPHDSPLIDPNYLNDPKDVQELVEGEFKTLLCTKRLLLKCSIRYRIF